MQSTTVQEKPILFSTEMIQAIRDGRKTQTRRVIKPQPDSRVNTVHPCRDAEWEFGEVYFNGDGDAIEYKACPYGKPGDELWVRETFALPEYLDGAKPSEVATDTAVLYPADEQVSIPAAAGVEVFGRNRPSIHMPRWASRIQLLITDIRVERVQDIPYRDILAEGLHTEGFTSNTYNDPENLELGMRDRWRRLWNDINAARGYPWESNPWVWVVEFKVKEIKS